MAINKNFVVKNGIQVGDNLIFGDSNTGNVGVGTTLPLSTLDVRGKVTSVSVGSTSLSVSGVSTLGVTNVTTLNATTGNIVTGVVTTISGTTATYDNISVGSSLSINGTLYMNGSPVGMGTTGVLNVQGINVNNINVSGVGTFNNINATGVSTFTQISAGGTTGTSGQVLTSTGTGITWSTPSVSIGLVLALGG